MAISRFGLFLGLAVVSQHLGISSGIDLTPQGGYRFKVVIHNDEKAPQDAHQYLSVLQTNIQVLSAQMYRTTKKFFIAEVEIVIPEDWNYSPVEPNPSTDSFGQADIRISSRVNLPHVENPNGCGVAGDYIEIPVSFFDSANEGAYGLNWKVLLVSWARYRWGVYEEHGVPGDARFPYFFRQTEENGQFQWVPSGCTNLAHNSQLNGEYRRLDNNEVCDPADPNREQQCRFFPSQSQNDGVRSSLMYLHFLESVMDFCDKYTHNPDAPTKQNLYCNRKSVQETIEATEDFKKVTAPGEGDEVPATTFKFFHSVSKPSVYILLDAGLTNMNNAGLLTAAITGLSQAVAEGAASKFPDDLVVGVGKFPTENGPGLENILPFGLLGVDGHRNKILDVLGNFDVVNNQVYDFARALEQAVNLIASTSPTAGGSIVFVKSDPARNTSSFTLEKEVDALLRENNIRLYSVEVAPTPDTTNLERLAKNSAGANHPVTKGGSHEDVHDFLKTNLDFAERTRTNERITWRQEADSLTEYKFPVLANSNTVSFHFVTTENISTSDFFGGIITDQVQYSANFTQAREYAQDIQTSTNRFIYEGTITTAGWIIKELLFIHGGQEPGTLIVVSDGDNLPEDITVDVTTSAGASGELDLGNIANPDAPFVVSVTIKQGQKAVIGATVQAVLEGSDERQEVTLQDNGAGADVTAKDGVYAVVVLPPKNGRYSISVTVSKGSSDAVRSFSEILLLPPDQNFPPAETVEIPEGIRKTSRLPKDLSVVNAEAYKPYIQRITNLEIVGDASQSADYTVRFNVPKYLTLGGKVDEAPTHYTLWMSSDKTLLENLDPKADPPAGVTKLQELAFENPAAGKLEQLQRSDARLTYVYFAVTTSANNGALHSVVSNIRGLDEAVPEASTSTESEDSSSAEPPTSKPEENKPWIKSTGGIVTVVVIVLVVLAAAGGGYWYMNKRRLAKAKRNATTQFATAGGV